MLFFPNHSLIAKLCYLPVQSTVSNSSNFFFGSYLIISCALQNLCREHCDRPFFATFRREYWPRIVTSMNAILKKMQPALLGYNCCGDTGCVGDLSVADLLAVVICLSSQHLCFFLFNLCQMNTFGLKGNILSLS